METNKVTAIMYGKFNNRDKNGSLLYANKDSAIVVTKSFKEILNEVVEDYSEDTPRIVEKGITVEESTTEVELLWQRAIHRNYVNEYNKKAGGR